MSIICVAEVSQGVGNISSSFQIYLLFMISTIVPVKKSKYVKNSEQNMLNHCLGHVNQAKTRQY